MPGILTEDGHPASYIHFLRTLPVSTPGKRALAKATLRRWLGARDVYLQDRFGFIYQVPALREIIGFSLLVDGIYEHRLMRLVRSFLRPGFVFVDVGAHIGTFTLPAARWVGSEGKVLSIEASPTVFFYLRHNVELNGLRNVILERCAASDQRMRQVAFYEAPIDRSGMGSLVQRFDSPPAFVETDTLGNLLRKHRITRVDAIKADVEGHEALVFRGSRQMLAEPNAPAIFFEFNELAERGVPEVQIGDSQRVLLECGYRIWRLADFLLGKRRPMEQVVTKGFDTLVAMKNA